MTPPLPARERRSIPVRESDPARGASVNAYESRNAVVTRPGGGAISTSGMAAHMTWKQAELLIILADGSMPLRELGDLVREIHAIDLAAGNRPMYWGVDDQGIRSCLAGLERRELVRQTPQGRWTVTARGREAAGVVR